MADDVPSIIELTTEIATSYVGNHQIPANDLPRLLQTIYGALKGDSEPAAESAAPATLTKAQIRKSIANAGLTSFEDGKVYKTLKRHLTLRGLTPADYRAKWGLPADYPMTAPSYSEQRSALAKSLGLGRKVGKVALETVAEPPAAPLATESAPKAPKARRKPRAITEPAGD